MGKFNYRVGASVGGRMAQRVVEFNTKPTTKELDRAMWAVLLDELGVAAWASWIQDDGEPVEDATVIGEMRRKKGDELLEIRMPPSDEENDRKILDNHEMAVTVCRELKEKYGPCRWWNGCVVRHSEDCGFHVVVRSFVSDPVEFSAVHYPIPVTVEHCERRAVAYREE